VTVEAKERSLVRARLSRRATTLTATLALLAPVAAVAGITGTAHAATVGAAATAAPTEDTVTLRLASPDQAAYDALVTSSALTRADRLARLAAVLPTAATRHTVEAVLAARGLRILAETDWTITAAAPAYAGGNLTTSKGRGMSGSDTPLSAAAVLGHSLDGLVTHILDTATTRVRVHPLLTPAVLDGQSVRTLYGAPVGPATATTPLTVATIQFSGWNDGDLSTYASRLGVADPLTNGQYTALSILGGDPTTPDGNSGEMEVALDQEALLATAPYVRQRAYFAANSADGFVTAVEQVATDAAQHPELGLAALSISWGGCEDTSASGIGYYDAMHLAIQDALAAGVTVFAATGDSGSFDCLDDQGQPIATPAVDYPASDPFVIGVGGTTADASLTAETAWSGSGGGESAIWPRPAYQSSLSLSGTGRLVPDMAAVADPESGLPIFVDGNDVLVGGTSLAAPLAAATLTTTLAQRKFTTGVGWIHPNLYAAPATSFRDVVAGDNGYSAEVGFDRVTGRGAPLWNKLITALDSSPTMTAPTYSRTRAVPVHVTVTQGMVFTGWLKGTGAQPTCSKTGATTTAPTSTTVAADGALSVYVVGIAYNGYCYTARRTVVVDTVAPVATTVAPSLIGRSIRFTWHGTDRVSGVASYTVTIKRSGTTTPVYAASGTTLTTKLVPLLRRHTYTMTVTAKDRAGNTSAVATRKIAL
jgi:kumamolisin